MPHLMHSHTKLNAMRPLHISESPAMRPRHLHVGSGTGSPYPCEETTQKHIERLLTSHKLLSSTRKPSAASYPQQSTSILVTESKFVLEN